LINPEIDATVYPDSIPFKDCKKRPQMMERTLINHQEEELLSGLPLL